jgi:hypothetical protein
MQWSLYLHDTDIAYLLTICNLVKTAPPDIKYGPNKPDSAVDKFLRGDGDGNRDPCTAEDAKSLLKELNVSYVFVSYGPS